VRKTLSTLGIAVALVLLAPGANAQTTTTDDINQLRADIQADRQAVVAKNLGLTDEEGMTFWPLYREYRNALAPAGDRLTKLIMDYAKNWEAVPDAQATAMLDEFLSIQKEQLRIKGEYVAKFRKLLPAKKVARFFQIENKLDAVVAVGLAANIPVIP